MELRIVPASQALPPLPVDAAVEEVDPLLIDDHPRARLALLPGHTEQLFWTHQRRIRLFLLQGLEWSALALSSQQEIRGMGLQAAIRYGAIAFQRF